MESGSKQDQDCKTPPLPPHHKFHGIQRQRQRQIVSYRAERLEIISQRHEQKKSQGMYDVLVLSGFLSEAGGVFVSDLRGYGVSGRRHKLYQYRAERLEIISQRHEQKKSQGKILALLIHAKQKDPGQMILYITVAAVTVLLGSMVNCRPVTQPYRTTRQQMCNRVCLFAVFLILYLAPPPKSRE